MKEVESLVRKYVKNAEMMQLATVSGDQPWCCTLHFVCDENLNFYWISKPEARHSKEILDNKKIAVAITVRLDDLNIVGIQVEGDAELVENEDEIKAAIQLYTDKFNRGEEWYGDFIAGNNEHKLYCIKPRMFVLFDSVNFPDDERREWKP